MVDPSSMTAPLTASALFIAMFWGLYRGWFVVKPTLDSKQAELDAQRLETEYWRRACQKNADVIIEMTHQMNRLGVTMDLSNKILTSATEAIGKLPSLEESGDGQ